MEGWSVLRPRGKRKVHHASWHKRDKGPFRGWPPRCKCFARVLLCMFWSCRCVLVAVRGKEKRAKSEPDGGRNCKAIKELPASERPEHSAAETFQRIKAFVHRPHTFLRTI